VSRTLLALFVALGAATRPVAAEEAPVFPVGLDVVNVTVTVRDENGDLVSDLKAEDFSVKEDGREQELLVFAPASAPEEREELALNLGMLFDTSNSMRENLKLSQNSAIRFLDAIPRAKDLILIFFDEDIRISRYNSENQQGIFGRILETESTGYTALCDAVAVYVSRVIGTPGRKVLVIFSDGADNRSATPASDVIRLVRSTNVTIYPVAFAGDRRVGSFEEIRARAFLGELAHSSGGQVFRPFALGQLSEIYTQILDELSSQYVLGYVSDNPRRDGKYRELEVEVSRPNLRVRHRPGYHAPEPLPGG
jgi:Ca-activated chloride channel family protein